MERGDRVATLLPSLPETAAVFLGAYRHGAILLSMSVLYGDEGIEHRLNDSGARVLVTDSANRQRIPDGLVDKVLVLRDDEGELRDGDVDLMDALGKASDSYETVDTRPTIPRSSTTRPAPRAGKGHPPRASLPARARGVRVVPRRARGRAVPRLR